MNTTGPARRAGGRVAALVIGTAGCAATDVNTTPDGSKAKGGTSPSARIGSR